MKSAGYLFLLILMLPACAGAEAIGSEEAALKQGIERFPASALRHEELGSFYLLNSRFAEAAAQFRTMLSLRPDDMAACYNLGFCLERLGQYDEAVRFYKKAGRFSADKIGFRIAVCYHALQQDEKAVPYFQRIGENLRTPFFHYAFAVSLAGADRYRDALRELRLAQNLDPAFTAGQPYFQTAYALEETRNGWLQNVRRQRLLMACAFLVGALWISFIYAKIVSFRRPPKRRVWEVKQVT